MARQVIILAQDTNAPANVFAFSVAFWAAVPSARQAFYANASATSAVTGLSGAELTAIQTGAVAEQVQQVQVANPTQQTLAAAFVGIQVQLQARFAIWQATVSANNPWLHFGTFWDGTSWTVITNS